MKRYRMNGGDATLGYSTSGWHPVSRSALSGNYGPIGNEFVTVQTLDKAIGRTRPPSLFGVHLLLFILCLLMFRTMSRVRALEKTIGEPGLQKANASSR